MSATELIATLGGSGVVIVMLGLIKIKPLEISVWHWLARKLGRAFNGEMFDKVDEIKEDVQQVKSCLDDHLREEEERDIISYRTKILRFADEMYMKKYHSKEHFEEIIDLINKYNAYCDQHPEFENERTNIAQGLIRDQYAECMKRNRFDISEDK